MVPPKWTFQEATREYRPPNEGVKKSERETRDTRATERVTGNLQGKKSQDARDSAGVQGNQSKLKQVRKCWERLAQEDEPERIPDAADAPEVHMRKPDGPNASEEQLRWSGKTGGRGVELVIYIDNKANEKTRQLGQGKQKVVEERKSNHSLLMALCE